MRPMEQRTVLVTGATDGLGRALAADLAGRGATVLVPGIDFDDVMLVKEYRRHGP